MGPWLGMVYIILRSLTRVGVKSHSHLVCMTWLVLRGCGDGMLCVVGGD